MAKVHVTTSINGEPMEYLCEPSDTMLDALRGPLGLTGSKEGCASGDCGACSITLDDRLVCSCLMLAVPIERRRQFRFSAPKMINLSQFAEWRLDLRYNAPELRYIDVVPAVLGLVTQVQALKEHQGALFLVLSELFNNALDHGLLGLDSATKLWIGGFELYMTQRTERLATLSEGRIDISFLLHQDESRAVLDISVNDSGPGFEYSQRTADAAVLSEANACAFGRGIALVNSLCEQLVYSGTGNKVWCRYVVSDLVQDQGPPSAANDVEPDGTTNLC